MLDLKITGLTLALLLAPLYTLGSQAGEPGHAVKRFELSIRERRLEQDDEVIRVVQGDTVEMNWTSDEKGSLHLHGYDIEFTVDAGEPTLIRFEARATGRFPVTSHGFGDEHGHGHEALLYVEVYPD